MTNYEKIKNMSVEEMAKFINELATCACECCHLELESYCNCDCLNGRKIFLESEITNDK